MAFKRSGGFSGRGNFRGGSDRPRFGRDRDFSRGPSRDRDQQMYSATCASCGKTCEVPFRPTGERPVYCKECFAKNRGESDYSERRERPARDFSRNDRPSAPAMRSDSGMDELKREVASVKKKLEMVLELLRTHSAAAEKPAQARSLASVVKKATKKAAKPKKTSAKK